MPLNLAGSNSVAHVDLPSLLLSLPKPSEDVKVDASDIAVVGIPRVPSDFVKCALALCHPVDAKIVLDIALEEAVSFMCRSTPLALRKHRLKWLSHALALARSLKPLDESMKSSMDPSLRKILERKRLALFDALLKEIDFPDQDLARDMAKGSPLAGWQPRTHVYQAQVKPPSLSLDQLAAMAPMINDVTFQKTRSSGDDESDRVLWQTSLDEVTAGWASGPHPLSSLPTDAIVSRRFAIWQKERIRAIDDLSASCINSAVGFTERLHVEGVDEIAALILRLLRSLKGSGRCIKGRSFDLRKAYRQLAIAPDHRRFAWVAVHDPAKNEPALFKLAVTILAQVADS